MILKSFGCSYIFGAEMPDDGRGGPRATPSRLTWPALLAEDLGLEYECYARSGSGNLQIAEQVLNHLASTEPAVYVIGWTWPDRYDYKNHDQWETIRACDNTKFSDSFFINYYSQYCNQLQLLLNIKLVSDILTAKKYPYIMTYMDNGHVFEVGTPAVTMLQGMADQVLTRFDGQGFNVWCDLNRFPKGPGGHPLQEAHLAAAEYIKVLYKQSINDYLHPA